MELSDVIGARLNEIQKKPDNVKLVFENATKNEEYILRFTGLLFETSNSALNRRVKNIQIYNTLGFRAISQLGNLKQSPAAYRQLFIQMDGSDENNKIELLGALKNYKVLPRRRALNKNRSAKKKIKRISTLNKE